MNISFYNLKSTPIGRALPVLLQKALDANMHPSVIVPLGTTDEFSHILWHGGGADSFLAHDINDTATPKSPIKLTDSPDFNRSVRFFVNDLQTDWIAGADSIYFIFDSEDTSVVHNARTVWRALQQATEYTLLYYQQDINGKWAKK